MRKSLHSDLIPLMEVQMLPDGFFSDMECDIVILGSRLYTY